MRRPSEPTRQAFTLLELVAATAIMATLSVASFSLVRTSHTAWRKHRNDAELRDGAVAALQHLMRRVRQATRVTSVTAASETAGAITLLMSGSTQAYWARNATTNELNYGTTSANNLLAKGVTSAKFTCYKADGVTATTQLDLIHAVRCELKYAVVRPSGSTTETVSCVAFLRSW